MQEYLIRNVTKIFTYQDCNAKLPGFSLREYFRRYDMEMTRLDILEYINKTGFGNNMLWDGNIEKIRLSAQRECTK